MGQFLGFAFCVLWISKRRGLLSGWVWNLKGFLGLNFGSFATISLLKGPDISFRGHFFFAGFKD